MHHSYCNVYRDGMYEDDAFLSYSSVEDLRQQVQDLTDTSEFTITYLARVDKSIGDIHMDALEQIFPEITGDLGRNTIYLSVHIGKENHEHI